MHEEIVARLVVFGPALAEQGIEMSRAQADRLPRRGARFCILRRVRAVQEISRRLAYVGLDNDLRCHFRQRNREETGRRSASLRVGETQRQKR